MVPVLTFQRSDEQILDHNYVLGDLHNYVWLIFFGKELKFI